MTSDNLVVKQETKVTIVKAEPPVSSPVPQASGPPPTYLVAIPPKANFSVDKRYLIVNGETIGLPLNQPEVMVELVKPAGQNDIAIQDWCLTNLVRNIATLI